MANYSTWYKIQQYVYTHTNTNRTYLNEYYLVSLHLICESKWVHQINPVYKNYIHSKYLMVLAKYGKTSFVLNNLNTCLISISSRGVILHHWVYLVLTTGHNRDLFPNTTANMMPIWCSKLYPCGRLPGFLTLRSFHEYLSHWYCMAISMTTSSSTPSLGLWLPTFVYGLCEEITIRRISDCNSICWGYWVHTACSDICPCMGPSLHPLFMHGEGCSSGGIYLTLMTSQVQRIILWMITRCNNSIVHKMQILIYFLYLYFGIIFAMPGAPRWPSVLQYESSSGKERSI